MVDNIFHNTPAWRARGPRSTSGLRRAIQSKWFSRFWAGRQPIDPFFQKNFFSKNLVDNMPKAPLPGNNSENNASFDMNYFRDSSILTETQRKEYSKLMKKKDNFQKALGAELEKLKNLNYATTEQKHLEANLATREKRIMRLNRDIEDLQRQLQQTINEKHYFEQEIEKAKQKTENGNTINYKFQIKCIDDEIAKLFSMYQTFQPAKQQLPLPSSASSNQSIQSQEEQEMSDTSSDYESWDGEFTDIGPSLAPLEPTPAPEPPAPTPAPAPVKKIIKMNRNIPTTTETKEPPLTQIAVATPAPPVPPVEERVISEREAYYRWCYDETGCPPAGGDDLDCFIERKKYRGISIPQKYYQSSFIPSSNSAPPAPATAPAPPAPPRSSPPASTPQKPQTQYSGLQHATKPSSNPIKKKVTWSSSQQPPVILSGKPKEVAPHANIYPIDVCSDGGESDNSLE